MSFKLKIFCNENYKLEREYIINVILGEFLGLEYDIFYQNRKDILIVGPDSKKMIINDTFFQIEKKYWLKEESLPRKPIDIFDTSSFGKGIPLFDKYIPVIYGDKTPKNHKQNYLPIDIFGSAFFMLTRYEEIVNKKRDKFNRFSAYSSIAYQENFLCRPIINEYIEILWFYLKQIWPSLKKSARQFIIFISHDVDRPFKYLPISFPKIIVKLAKYKITIKELLMWILVKTKNAEKDPFYTFDWIMDACEKNGIKCTFNFIPKNYKNEKYQSEYSISSLKIKSLLKKINIRGHSIGYHASFNSYNNPYRIKKEFEYLKKITASLKISQRIWGGRHHYLQWDAKNSWGYWEYAGLNYDSTLSYPEETGFRCGNCFSYPVYDVMNRKKLKLYEKPLMVMDATVAYPLYMNIKEKEEIINHILKYKEICKLFDGEFNILWHNNNVIDDTFKRIYTSILAE